MLTLGQFLKTKRLQKNISATKISKQAKVSSNSIWMWENDESRPTLRNIEKICAAYEIKDAEIKPYIEEMYKDKEPHKSTQRVNMSDVTKLPMYNIDVVETQFEHTAKPVNMVITQNPVNKEKIQFTNDIGELFEMTIPKDQLSTGHIQNTINQIQVARSAVENHLLDGFSHFETSVRAKAISILDSIEKELNSILIIDEAF